MTERVKWDHTYGYELEIMPNIDEPHNTIKVRSEGEQADSVTEWVDVVSHYPDDYLPDFPELLGPFEFRLEADGLAHKYFYHADFSLASVRAVLEDRIDSALDAALRDTDSYVIREIETGEKIPQSVALSRDIARKKAAQEKQKARSARPSDLPMIEWRIPPTKGERKWTPPNIDKRDPAPATPPDREGRND